MTEAGHGGEEIQRLRAENDELRAELAQLKARMEVESVVLGATAPQTQQVQPQPEPALSRASGRWGAAGIFKGGVLGAALVAGVEWLRRHREVPVALVVAVVAAVAAWLLWPDDQQLGQSPGPPPVTVTHTSVSSLSPPAATPTPSATVEPTTMIEPTTLPPIPTPTSRPAGRSPTVMPVETRRTSAPTVVPPTSAPTTSNPPTTVSPTRPSPTADQPSCRVRVVVLPGKKLIEVCVR